MNKNNTIRPTEGNDRYEIWAMRQKGIKPQEAVTILKRSGIEVTEEQANEILELLYFLAHLSIDQLIDKTL